MTTPTIVSIIILVVASVLTIVNILIIKYCQSQSDPKLIFLGDTRITTELYVEFTSDHGTKDNVEFYFWLKKELEKNEKDTTKEAVLQRRFNLCTALRMMSNINLMQQT